MRDSLERQLERFPQLRETLNTVVEIASTEPIESILLVGSMARGEITVRSGSAPFDLWSDIDLFIVSRPGKKLDQGRLRSEYRSIFENLGMPNPFFHIDFTAISSARLDALPPRISTFEAQKNGRTIWGRDVQGDLPHVTLDNLDFGNTNHLILVRLTEMLFHIPERIIFQCPNTYEEMVFSYVQARNALDILTILLPHEGILLPGYTLRNQFLQENYPAMQSRAYMSADFPNFQSEALAGKLALDFKTTSADLYAKTLRGYINLLAFLLQAGPFEHVGDISDALKNSDLKLESNQVNFQQNLANFKFLALSKLLGRPAIHPAHSRKMIIIFLLWMHASLLAHLRGQESATPSLRRARELLQTLALRPLPDKVQNFAKEWSLLRNHYLEVLASLYPAKKARRSYYRQVIEWQYTP